MRFSAPAPSLRHGSLRAPPSGLELRALLSEVRASTDRTQFAARRRFAAAGALALALVVMLAGPMNFDFLPIFVRADASRPYLPRLRGDSSRARAAGAPASESPKYREQIREESRMRVVQHALRGVTVGVSMGMALAAGSAAHGQNAVQWRVEDGGNGHWYQWIDTGTTLSNAVQAAFVAERGAHLWTVTSAAEAQFLALHAPPENCMLGGFRGADGVWRWMTGEIWMDGLWCPGQPDYDHENRATYCRVENGQVQLGNVDEPWQHMHFVALEWSADCNADGIVDYGQILAGELEDANANNIPDCCEAGTPCDTCPGDIDESGAVNGVDLAAVLNNWGTNGGKYPRADINGDGTVDASDLAFVLSTWGACP